MTHTLTHTPTLRLAGLAALTLALAWAAPAAQAQARFVPSADGTEVQDVRTGLIWRRCIEGMAWSGGTCTGTPATFTHEQALAHAQAQAGWRLPNVKELSSLADRTRAFPAIDGDAFPATPSTWFWASSPYAGYPDFAWYVDFNHGSVSNYLRNYLGAVRLVRASQ